MRWWLAAMGGIACVACSGGEHGASSQGSTGTVPVLTGASGATGSAGVSASGSSGQTAGTSSGAGTATTTGGVPFAPCNAGFAYFDGNCLAANCVGSPVQTLCGASDGGVGFCANGVCQLLDLATDSANCGAFGVLCPGDTTCQGSECLTLAGTLSACDAGACPTEQVCLPMAGCVFTAACQDAPDDTSCLSGSALQTCCAAQCTNEQLDPNNCGACGVVCDGGSACLEGICRATSCSGSTGPVSCVASADMAILGICCGTVCVNPATDANNCGGCGQTCPGLGSCNFSCDLGCTTAADCAAGQACLDGYCLAMTCAGDVPLAACGLQVSAGLLLSGACCGTTCTDLADDPANCGGCGVSCGAGACEQGSCLASPPVRCAMAQNGAACWSNGQAGSCCAGACTFDDDSNCGSCGQVCPLGSHCTAGSFGPSCLTGGLLGNCLDAGCAVGEGCIEEGLACAPTTCAAGSGEIPCASAGGGEGVCCDGTCSDLGSDSSNCGGCGQVCPPGSTCADDACLSSEIASETCVQLGCPPGLVCEPSGSCLSPSCAGVDEGQLCAFGLQVGTADAVEGICCGGQCVDVGRDVGNCGGCGLWCDAGTCVGEQGSGHCEPAVANQACVQTCGVGSYCLGTACEPLSCLEAGALCPAEDGRAGLCCATGSALTCADLTSDPDNCGGCLLRCPEGQRCSGGVCSGTPVPCQAAGSIGAYCALDAGLLSICCPGIGCVDLSTDEANCGACGIGCVQGTRCVAGACS